MRLAPNMGVPQLREELQRIDTWAKHVSAGLGRVAFSPQGSGPAGGSAGVVPDLTQFWYLPGRAPEQRAYGRNLLEAIPISAGGAGTPSISPRVGVFAHDEDKGVPGVWMAVEGTDGAHVTAGHADRPFKQNRYWVFPAMNQLATGEGQGLHYFVDQDDWQLLQNKTFTSWVLELPDISGVGLVSPDARGETQAGTAKAAVLPSHRDPAAGRERGRDGPHAGEAPHPLHHAEGPRGRNPLRGRGPPDGRRHRAGALPPVHGGPGHAHGAREQLLPPLAPQRLKILQPHGVLRRGRNSLGDQRNLQGSENARDRSLLLPFRGHPRSVR